MRVAVVAASNIVRAGLAALLRGDPGLEVAGVFADAGEIGEAEVVLAAPGESPLEPLLDLAAQAGGPAVVLVTDDPDPAAVAEALSSGVYAVLPGDAAPGELLAAVNAAGAGLVSIRRSDLAPLLGGAAVEEHPPAAASGEDVLTPRELEVLRLLAEGMPNKNIAWKLGISEHTVKFHVASILTRLNASSRAQAVAVGVRRGLILL